jgi:hypothetical protein
MMVMFQAAMGMLVVRRIDAVMQSVHAKLSRRSAESPAGETTYKSKVLYFADW